MRFPGFIGPSYTLLSANVECQRCVNWYPELDDLGTGKEGEVAHLSPTPGLRLLVTLPGGAVRGTFTASNRQLFAVGGNKLYRISSAFVATELGSLNTASGPVSMADNGLQLVIVDGPDGYVWDFNAATFNVITDPNFLGADQVTFQDGYFLFNKPNSEEFFISGLNAITFDALDIAIAEALPDNLVGLLSFNQNIYLFGTETVEVFYDSGAALFPFERIQGAVASVGCSAPFSIAKLSTGPVWIGGDERGLGIVYRMQAYQPQRISTFAIETVIRALTTDQVAGARAWAYQQGGHEFYVLNIPGAASTWVYDATTNLWHERTYLNLWSDERHRADCHAVAFGLNIVGDYQNGNVYALDPDTTSDNGASIARMRTSPHISKGMVRNFYSSFQLDMEVGVGTSTGQGQNPQAILQWSDDGGHTWSNEHWADIGKIGNTKTRVIWRRLGSSRDRVFRVRITDPVKAVLIGAELGLQQGAA